MADDRYVAERGWEGVVLDPCPFHHRPGCSSRTLLIKSLLCETKDATPEQLRERVALHRGTTVGVDGEPRLDAVPRDGLGEELSREVLALL
jgi:hypothetical protein